MIIQRLILRNFRNYPEAIIDFAPRINVMCGANAQGKTSLLEAIFLCVSGRSFRSSHLAEMQRQGQTFFSVDLYFTKNEIDQRLRYVFNESERQIICNNTLCQSIAQLLGIIPGVVMTPDDVALIKGSPSDRRHFLDLQIAQANPLYLHHLARFQRAMRHRNQLLKLRQSLTIESWEQEMAQSASYITLQRDQAVADLGSRAGACYASLTQESEPLFLKYKTGAPLHDGSQAIVNYYLERYCQMRPREMELGWSASGPHKDDLQIAIQGKAGKAFASEGQQRSCVAALRIAEWERLKQQSGNLPLLLIDDVGMGLDAARRERLLNRLHDCGQVFLSSCQELQGALKDSVKFFRIDNGTIE